MDLTLSSSVQYIPRVGPKMAKKLEILGITTVKDLLWHIPFRYNDYSLISPISKVQPGETVTIQGEIESIKNAFTKTGKKLQQAKLRDKSGTINIIWFNQMYLTNIIKPGATLSVSGKVDWFGSSIVMVSPEYEIANEQSLHTGRLVPVYSETEGLSSKWLRGRIAYTIDACIDQVEIHLQSAIKSIHFPQDLADASTARKKLAFDELFHVLLHTREKKREWQQTKKSYPLQMFSVEKIISSLPFELTPDQKKVVSDILTDLKNPYAMNRILVGDVGSGKTVVAAIAMYIMYKNALQSILLAPTEILVRQHYETLRAFLSPLGITVGIITSSEKEIKNAHILVGTHALFYEREAFKNVGLVVIDEQQRFGVMQRELLTKKTTGNYFPHHLTMTATPIPRTVAQTIWGNLDLSVLVHMPKGRMKVKTWVVPQQKRDGAYDWIEKQIKTNKTQAFIVCPLIEESETMGSVKAVKKEFERLKNEVFAKFRLGLLHGRLSSKEKSSVLEKFRKEKLDILVTTPVVEVGIDIPSATIMMIEAADRFGLSQLHQLRGRVGRRNQQSYCLLFTENETAIARLKAMETIQSGPELAEADMRLRGPGEMFGTKQHGFGYLRIADFWDTTLLDEVRAAVVQYPL